MKKESKEKIVCIVMLGVIVILSGWFGGLIDDKFDEERMQISNPILTVVAASEIVDPAEIENETVQVETNETLEIESVPEIITAKDIDFVITQFYLEGLLHLHAQTNIPREKILLEIIKIGDFRDIGISKIPIITDVNGMIFLDNQWIRFENGYAYKANFYYNGNKIASSTSGIVEQGKASFGFVTLSTQRPSQYSVRIITQKYYDMKLYLDGETNILLDHCIVGNIVRINETRREIQNVNKIIKIKSDKNGEINIDGKESRTISAGLGTGYYKLTLIHKNTKNILCILGFEVISEKISEDELVLKGIHWVKNVYIPTAAI
jgi:hypothetical protein